MLENSCSSDVSIQQQLEFATAKPSTFHEVNILKCRYTTKKWYLDDQFFFFPLVEDRFVGELVSGESWGATLTHQHESWKIVSDFKPPEKFYSTHLPANQIDMHTLKQTHVQFPKNDRKKEKVVVFFLRLAAFGPGHWVNLNAVCWISTSFLSPTAAVFWYSMDSSSIWRLPRRKMNKMNLKKALRKRKIFYKTPIYTFQVPC